MKFLILMTSIMYAQGVSTKCSAMLEKQDIYYDALILQSHIHAHTYTRCIPVSLGTRWKYNHHFVNIVSYSSHVYRSSYSTEDSRWYAVRIDNIGTYESTPFFSIMTLAVDRFTFEAHTPDTYIVAPLRRDRRIIARPMQFTQRKTR